MADFIVFDEGAPQLLNGGWPATVYWLLSTKSVDYLNPFKASDTLSQVTPHLSSGEIAGTGYARISTTTPTVMVGREVALGDLTWYTLTATDWPSNVRSIVGASTMDDTGFMLAAWNLIPQGVAVDLSSAGQEALYQPIYAI